MAVAVYVKMFLTLQALILLNNKSATSLPVGTVTCGEYRVLESVVSYELDNRGNWPCNISFNVNGRCDWICQQLRWYFLKIAGFNFWFLRSKYFYTASTKVDTFIFVRFKHIPTYAAKSNLVRSKPHQRQKCAASWSTQSKIIHDNKAMNDKRKTLLLIWVKLQIW